MGDWGGLAFNLVGTWTKSYVTQPITGGGTFDCAGLYGVVCSSNANLGPTPKWRSKLRVTWTTPWPVTISADWRYVSSVKFDVNSTNPFLADPLGRHDIPDATIPAYNWFDLSATWKVRDTVTLRAGVNNVFDKDPPLTSTAYFSSALENGNTFPGVYDALGRFLFANVTIQF